MQIFLIFFTASATAGEYNTENIVKLLVGRAEGKNLYCGAYLRFESGWDMYAALDKFDIHVDNFAVNFYMPKPMSKTYNLGFGSLKELVYSGEVFVPFVILNFPQDYSGNINVTVSYKTCNNKICVPHTFKGQINPNDTSSKWHTYIHQEIDRNEKSLKNTVKNAVVDIFYGVSQRARGILG